MSAGHRATNAPDLARLWPLAAGVALLTVLWVGPLPERAVGSFAAHMVMHMGLVAVASPLLAIGVLRAFPALAGRLGPGLTLAAAFLELVVVWGWHAPALHDAARRALPMLLAEQGSFLAAGLLVWTTALGAGRRPLERAAGVGGLFLTSMHMTLLGALLIFSGRPLYACAELCAPLGTMTPLADQQAGGAIMLAVGGLAYLGGGLALLAPLLSDGREKAAAP